ncbi:Nrap protein nucleotidyltransferase [Gracilaria domingensis]|nr:Nrap protein nucleotidyltransferase [Gracilaria domingensis]
MSPARARDRSPVAKRQRKNDDDDDPHMDIQVVQDAELNDESLCSPSIAVALDSIISQRKTSEERRKHMEQSLHDLKASLDKIPKKEKRHAFKSSTLRKTFKALAKDVKPESKFHSDEFQELSIQCSPPTCVRVVGGFLLGYSSNSLDVLIEIPSNILQERDYLNYRYHDKRLLYLTYIARHLLHCEKEKWMNIRLFGRCLNGDSSKPTLTLSPVEFPGVEIRLIPAYADGVFDKDRLAEDRKNVRPQGDSSVVKDVTEATTRYNASILVDATLEQTLKLFHSTLSNVASLRDTILLLEAWRIRHRLFNSNFYFAAVIHDIISRGAAPLRASREHLLRSVLTAISAGILKSISVSGIRIGSCLEDSVLQRAARSAATALRTIESKGFAEDPWYGVVPYLFATARGTRCSPRPLSTFFDGFINVSMQVDSYMTNEKVHKLLKRALFDTKRLSRLESVDQGLFGFSITSFDDACRKVDLRPSSWDASSFNQFWGAKSSLRRFKDGKIVEALIWTGGLSTISEIVEYVVAKHLGHGFKTKVVFDDVDKAAGMLSIDEVSSKAIATFNQLASVLRSLEGLPLGILGVHACSPHLRRCGAYAIRPSSKNKFIQAMNVIASFESSGAWPDDAVAISAAKAAFYAALKSKLAERGIIAQATISFVDIQLGEFVFRLRIRVEKEKELLCKHPPQADALKWVTETSVRHHVNILDVKNRMMGRVTRLAKRWLNSHMLLSQMGDRADELVEVLVASVLTNSNAPEPKSSFRGFCQFLHLLAEFPWEVCPLTVLLGNQEATGEDSEDAGDRIETDSRDLRVSAQKQFAGDGCAMNVYCDLDEDGEAVGWFPKAHSPEAVIVRRIRETAKASLGFVEKWLWESGSNTLETIFSPSKDEFAAVLQLNTEYIPFHTSSTSGALRAHGRSTNMHSWLVDFDPMSILMKELSNRFGRYALFMMRMNGGSELFVVWRPLVFKPTKFSLREAPFRIPSGERKAAEMNLSIAQLVSEMKQIGGDLITSVRLKENA